MRTEYRSRSFAMRINQVLLVVTAATCCVCATSVASTGPDDRQLTDPASVVSASDPAARPAPIEDLYYTRNVFGAAWSPEAVKLYSRPTFRAVSICGRCAP